MNQSGSALALVESWISAIIAFFVAIFDVIGNALRQLLDSIGVPGNIQTIIIFVVGILFIVAVFRIFGGVIRILLALFLILLLIHIVLPNVT
jgi:hypothetical protein